MSTGISPLHDPVGYPGTPIATTGVLTRGVLRPGPGAPDQRPRHPVLAIGSNADPAQLRCKFGDDVVLPVTAVRLIGLRIVHSAHVSAPGYVPYTAVQDPAAGPLPALLLWPDDDQMRVLDTTEPNYRRLPCPLALTGADAAARAAILPAPGGYQLYVSRWGALTDRPGGARLPAGSQSAAYQALATRSWFRRVVPEWAVTSEDHRLAAVIAGLRSDPARRAEVRDRLAAERRDDRSALRF